MKLKAWNTQPNTPLLNTHSRRLYEMDEMGNKRGENIRHAVPFVRQITEDGKPKLEVYRPTTNPIYIWTQVGQPTKGWGLNWEGGVAVGVESMVIHCPLVKLVGAYRPRLWMALMQP